MPTYTLRPQTLAERLQALVQTSPLRALAGNARWQALPAARRWQVLAAAATALVLLTTYVLTLQAAVERGEALREQRRQQGITTFGAGTPPAGVQTASPSSTRS